MLDIDTLNIFADWVDKYGLLALWIVAFLGPLGVPSPSPLLFAAAGAFARQNLFPWPVAILVALSANLLADTIVFHVGRFGQSSVYRRFGESEKWEKAAARFRQQGGLAIVLTRFPLTPLAFPTTLVAGGSHYPFLKYLVFDVIGTLILFLVYGGLGFAFGKHWQSIVLSVSRYTSWIVGILFVGVVLYLLIRWRRSQPPPQGHDQAVPVSSTDVKTQTGD